MLLELRDQVGELTARLSASTLVMVTLSAALSTRQSGTAGPMFIAGVFADLARWNGLSPIAKVLVVAGLVAALLLLGTGFVGTAVWTRFGIRIATRMTLRGGPRGRAGYATARYISQFAGRTIQYPVPRLQHTFEHAVDFGIEGTWNKLAGEQFRKVLEAHVRGRGTLVIEGTYRLKPVTHFFDPRTG